MKVQRVAITLIADMEVYEVYQDQFCFEGRGHYDLFLLIRNVTGPFRIIQYHCVITDM